MYSGGDTLPEVPVWYTDGWFEENFKTHFNLLHKEVIGTINIAGKEKNHRVLYIGKKILQN
jgi:hypothetical protein